jgi:TPR repeat protein
MGRYFEKGLAVPKNEIQAVYWYKEAALKGHVYAQCNLAVCYYQGRGVTRDVVESYKWMLLASQGGDMVAQQNISTIGSDLSDIQKDKAVKMAKNIKQSTIFKKSGMHTGGGEITPLKPFIFENE